MHVGLGELCYPSAILFSLNKMFVNAELRQKFHRFCDFDMKLKTEKSLHFYYVEFLLIKFWKTNMKSENQII